MLIRKGQSVAYSPYSLHRREDFFGADAEDFRPERWDEDIGLNKDEVTKAWGYVPFNRGLDCFWEVSCCVFFWFFFWGFFFEKKKKLVGRVSHTEDWKVNFAMVEVAYAVVAILRRFPAISLPHSEGVMKTGKEAQIVTITLAPAEGCRICLE